MAAILAVLTLYLYLIMCNFAIPPSIQDYEIPAGDLLMLSPYWLHRDPKHFPEPQMFRPVSSSMECSHWRGMGVGQNSGAYWPFKSQRTSTHTLENSSRKQITDRPMEGQHRWSPTKRCIGKQTLRWPWTNCNAARDRNPSKNWAAHYTPINVMYSVMGKNRPHINICWSTHPPYSCNWLFFYQHNFDFAFKYSVFRQ